MNSEGYAKPDLLAETEWLAVHLDDPKVRVVDCDLSDAFNRAHLPGAVNAGGNHYIKGEDGVHVMPKGKIGEFMGNLGIGDDTLVVTYDQRNSVYAARLWWVLNYYGHTNVKVLNGGWRKWLAEDRPGTDGLTTVAKATFTPQNPEETLIVMADRLESEIGREGTVVWDLRSRDEYTGKEIRGNSRSGHIPGAVHMEWSDVMDTEGLSTFKPAEEIREALASCGITPEKQVYTH